MQFERIVADNQKQPASLDTPQSNQPTDGATSKISEISQNILRKILFGSTKKDFTENELAPAPKIKASKEDWWPFFDMTTTAEHMWSWSKYQYYINLRLILLNYIYFQLDTFRSPNAFYSEKNTAWEDLKKHSESVKCTHNSGASKQLKRVPLHHQRNLPDPFGNEIEQELDSLSVEIQVLYNRAKWFFITSSVEHLEHDQLKIIDFLDGTIALDNIGLTKQNALRFLTLTKLVDLTLIVDRHIWRSRIVFQNSTYAIRTRILELLSPELQTSEAYTKTLDPNKLNNPDYMQNPANWMSERMGVYAKFLLPIEYTRTIELSKRLQNPLPQIFAIRGPTAAGKTTFLRNKFKHLLNEKGELLGCINLDSMKYVLRLITSENITLINTQVHDEVAKGPLGKYKATVLRKPNLSLIIDARLSLGQEIDQIARAALLRKGKSTLIDLDISLETSLLRVLERNPHENETCPDSNSIAQAWLESRKCRIAALLTAQAFDFSCELYHQKNHQESQLVLSVQGTDDKLSVKSEDFLLDCYTVPNEHKIHNIINQIITPQLLEEMKFPPTQNLLQWEDFSLQKAVDFHSMQTPVDEALKISNEEKHLHEPYGMATLQPFTASWLSDFPQIKEHLDSEHVLHVRGVDAGGEGFTWPTNKFSSKLNPIFNPEAIGGFEMKLGYFIIPTICIKKFSTDSISPKILQDLEVKNPDGEIEGYRFFVHPTAYTHFQALHDVEIQFVKPEKSEFIGTPTSTYRSWAVRRIVESEDKIDPYPNSIPFIVKMGVAHGSNTNRLITSQEIERSIKLQKHYDTLQHKDNLIIFSESLGLSLDYITNYPPKPPFGDQNIFDSGIIIREFPQELLDGKVKILSFSAVMSMERTHENNHGLCKIKDSDEKLHSLPLIFEIIDRAIKKGLVKSTFEFIKRYLVTEGVNALEPLIFNENLSLPIHAQNLCFVLNEDGTPRGLALRDHGDVRNEIQFIETYSWFYRYHVFVKLMNVLIKSSDELLPFTPGGPALFGNIIQKERSLYPYLEKLHRKPLGSDNDGVKEALEDKCISYDEFINLLDLMDQKYLQLLSQYFDLEKEGLSFKSLEIPSAEINSSQSEYLFSLNKILFRNKKLKA